MTGIDRKSHWDRVYSSQGEAGLSWYQSEPRLSLELIRDVAPSSGGRLLDVGGGSSVLVDYLSDLSFEKIAVLDISEAALNLSKARLGERAAKVEWIAADITKSEELGLFDVWHDRAVFHFLTDAEDRHSYVDLARRTIPAGGHLILACFADDGPKRCSDLDVRRYNADSLSAELGEGFSRIRETRERHLTPWGSSQSFVYGVFRRR